MEAHIPIPDSWISSAISHVADPSSIRAATPLELARTCFALQGLLEQQQQRQQQQPQQQQEEIDKGVGLQARILQALVVKLQGSTLKALAVKDLVEVMEVRVCVCVCVCMRSVCVYAYICVSCVYIPMHVNV
jgi:hypothetical protein